MDCLCPQTDEESRWGVMLHNRWADCVQVMQGSGWDVSCPTGQAQGQVNCLCSRTESLVEVSCLKGLVQGQVG